MSARALQIVAKHRRAIGHLASLRDFTYTPAETVDEAAVLDRSLSLYCLDHSNQQGIFVQLPPDVRLDTVPFVYQAQYDHAERLVSVPYECLLRLADDLPRIERLVMVYMTGRCGSTLLSHAFNRAPSAFSLSEPDAATQFVHSQTIDAEVRALLRATVRLLFKETSSAPETTCVLKLRSEGIRAMELFQSVFPGARCLFLYRDVHRFVSSFSRVFARHGLAQRVPVAQYLDALGRLFHSDFSRLAAYLEPGAEQLSIAEQLTLWWIGAMDLYLAGCDGGFPMLAVRYKDLVAHQREMLGAIFEHCGLPLSEVPDALQAFARDSQAGTALGWDDPAKQKQLPLAPVDSRAVEAIVGRHPALKDPDLVAPATFRPRATCAALAS
jgi:hypothetical protein